MAIRRLFLFNEQVACLNHDSCCVFMVQLPELETFHISFVFLILKWYKWTDFVFFCALDLQR